MSIQPAGAKDVTGRLRLLAEYEIALHDLEGFSHIILLYHFHRLSSYDLTVT